MRDGGPAFPHSMEAAAIASPSVGMSLRDYFAAAALQEAMRQTDAVMWNTRIEIKPEPRSNAARIAYEAADAMLAERGETMTAAQPTESRAEMILRWEREGRLDPNCPGCREFYESPLLPVDVSAPNHKASSGCESGKRAHCTCDFCW